VCHRTAPPKVCFRMGSVVASATTPQTVCSTLSEHCPLLSAPFPSFLPQVVNTALDTKAGEAPLTLPCSPSGPFVGLAFKLEEGR
jgi:hypothetical protein